VRVECFGQSRAQDGRQQSLNQDAFVIGRGPVAWMGLCDGAGNAQSVAKRALALLESRVREAPLAQVLRPETRTERMTLADRITIDPDVMQGKPVIRGTRITVDLILRKLAEGATESDILDAYPHLAIEDVRAALTYAADTVSHETILFTGTAGGAGVR